MSLLAALAILGLGWWGLRAFSRASPQAVVLLVKRIGGAAAFLIAAILLVRGRMDMALLAAGAGAWLFGWSWFPLPAWVKPLGLGRKPTGGASTVRSARIVVELDHASGEMRGRVAAGPFAGRELASFSDDELRELRRSCLGDDVDGVRLLETYLDRRSPGWREYAEADRDAGAGPYPKRGPMTEEEAYQVLGLQPGADASAIRLAHRELMKKLHPDQGGTNDLASRVNQAKDLLLHRHR